MYNHMLDTFIMVVDCGSFTKAANKLYISPTAIMKQINTLENHLQLKLINRSSSGVNLTIPGKIIYEEAKKIIEASKQAINKANVASEDYDKSFCVGTSLLNPAKPFMDLWYQLSTNFPGYKLHLVPFEDDHHDILSVIDKLGESFDFLIGVCDSKKWLSRCQFVPLGSYRKMIAVSHKHHLANKKVLTIEDLYGETLLMVPAGDSSINDFIRNDLQSNHPQITIEDTLSFYDLSVFNYCYESNKVLLTIECWKDVHPALVTIPINWDYRIPYGLLLSNNAPKDVISFAKESQKLLNN